MSGEVAPRSALNPIGGFETVPALWRAMVRAYSERVTLRWNGQSFTARSTNVPRPLLRGYLPKAPRKGRAWAFSCRTVLNGSCRGSLPPASEPLP
jgi:hypothetical protein